MVVWCQLLWCDDGGVSLRWCSGGSVLWCGGDSVSFCGMLVALSAGGVMVVVWCGSGTVPAVEVLVSASVKCLVVDPC